MSLDPQADAFLQRLAAAGGTPMYTLTPELARENHSRATATVALPGEAVAEVRELAVPGPGGEVPVRVYVPEPRGREGTLVYVHGGGFVVGTLDSFDNVCRALANRCRTTVVSVGYRLAPEHPYPAAVQDCVAVVEWVGSGAGEPFVARGPLVVAGDSAGGNLAALTAIAVRDADGPPLEAQVLLYPMADASMRRPSMRELADGYYLLARDIAWFWEHYLGARAATPEPGWSPLHVEDLSGLPPALVVTAGYDPLRDEGDAYAQRLQEAGTPVQLRRFDGMIHGFARMTALFDQATVALDEVGGFVRALPVGRA